MSTVRPCGPTIPRAGEITDFWERHCFWISRNGQAGCSGWFGMWAEYYSNPCTVNR